MASRGLSCGENGPQLRRSPTIYSTSPNLPSLPLSSGRNKQKSSSSPLFVCISFPLRKRARLKYSATLKWHVTLTRLFSLMSSSPNPSMIHLLPTPSLKWGTLQNSYWLRNLLEDKKKKKELLGFRAALTHQAYKWEPCDTMVKWISAHSPHTPLTCCWATISAPQPWLSPTCPTYSVIHSPAKAG